jgi:hypothetical protein
LKTLLNFKENMTEIIRGAIMLVVLVIILRWALPDSYEVLAEIIAKLLTHLNNSIDLAVNH